MTLTPSFMSRAARAALMSGTLAASAWLLSGCGGGGDSPSPAAPVAAAAACSSLKGVTLPSSDIGLATKGATVNDANLVAAAGSLGEYCRVVGSIAPVDPTAQSINFALALPTQWNNKAMHIGGGGFDGVVPDLTATALVSGPSPLARGYATFASDGGHQNNGDAYYTAFGLNDEMLRNYGGEALKKTRDVVMKLIASRYGSAPTRTYFIGGSQGGHEGMAVMQRWGQDYDGIITNYPAYGYMPQILAWQGFARALRGNGGAGYLTPGKIQTIHAAELAACDGLDGAMDGIVSNVAACTFSPSVLRCANGADIGDSCLSDTQIQTLQSMQTRTNFPYALKGGVTNFSGFNVFTYYEGILGLGSTATFPVPPNPGVLGLMSGYADAILRGYVLRDPSANTLTFDPLNPGTYTARIQEVSEKIDSTSTDIQPFMAKGKWILVHGLSDQLIAVGGSIDYYNALVAKFGASAVGGFMRFYTVPGYGHGTGWFNASAGLPTLDALEAWVETGTAPATLVVTDSNPGTKRTRPLCQYPNWPRYGGTGDINSAASYTCVTH